MNTQKRQSVMVYLIHLEEYRGRIVDLMLEGCLTEDNNLDKMS
jgi:hypothetical protein